MHDGHGVDVNRSGRSNVICESLEARRLLAAGDPDLTFGTGGKVALGADIDDALGTKDVLIPYDANRVLLVGKTVLQRRNLSDGSLDTTFGSGSNGIGDLPGGLSSTRYGQVRVLSSGKIVIEATASGIQNGTNNRNDFAIRLNADGTTDQTFG